MDRNYALGRAVSTNRLRRRLFGIGAVSQPPAGDAGNGIAHGRDGAERAIAWQRRVMADRLFLSFWDLCLDNLPEGRCERRSISATDASLMIRAARENNTLQCVI